MLRIAKMVLGAALDNCYKENVPTMQRLLIHKMPTRSRVSLSSVVIGFGVIMKMGCYETLSPRVSHAWSDFPVDDDTKRRTFYTRKPRTQHKTSSKVVILGMVGRTQQYSSTKTETAMMWFAAAIRPVAWQTVLR